MHKITCPSQNAEQRFAHQAGAFLMEAEEKTAALTLQAQAAEQAFLAMCEAVGERQSSPEDVLGVALAFVHAFDAACLRVHGAYES